MRTPAVRPVDRKADSLNKHAHYLFLINPDSGKTSLSTKKNLVAQVSKHVNARTLISESESHASQLSRDAMMAGDTVVACGGDGFQNIVAQQAVETGGVMAILPFGRGNDFANSLQIRTIRDAEDAIKKGSVHFARYVDVEFSDYSRICLTCAGVGLLSEASFRAARLPLLKGKLLYTAAALISLMKLRCHHYALTLDDSETIEELLIFIGAASEYTGGGIHIAPQATSNPDKLNVLYATSLGRAAAVGLLMKALSGKHLTHPKVRNQFHQRCRVTCEPNSFWASLVYGDGEHLGDLPANLQIGSKPLRVLVPHAIS
ncbi:diacylglycerol kinase family protein [Marimonas sp. MJW-29]|uniref:Diacylglycerol kinase family protein n=1 Tax=Sulfitobacter sediminis TaxID=3234186 RepID=A0ABV3RT31_9RHOB